MSNEIVYWTCAYDYYRSIRLVNTEDKDSLIPTLSSKTAVALILFIALDCNRL